MSNHRAHALQVLGLLALAPAAVAGVTESFWIVQGGNFNDPANWNGPVPDANVTAIFDLDLDICPCVEFDGDAVSDRVIVRAGIVYFELWDIVEGEVLPIHYDLVSPTVGAASLVVAEEGDDVAELRIRGGSITAESMVIGLMAGSSGTVDLRKFVQAFPELTCNGLLHVGSAGQGLLIIQNQATVFSDGATLGVQDGAFGEVVLNEASQWTVGNQLTVGKQGQGLLTISGLADLTSGSAIIGQSPDSIGDVSLIGQGSNWTNNGSLDVGFQGQGTLLVSGGGAVFTHGFATIGTLPAPQFPPLTGGTGDVTVTGPASLWLIDDDLDVGFLWVGSFNVLDGATVTSFSGTVGFSEQPGTEARIEGPGSVWSNIGDVTVYSPALLRVVDGAILIVDSLEVLPGAELKGDATVLGDVVSYGIIRVGDPIGTLTIYGALTSTEDLQLELAGPAPGAFDRLEVTSYASLSGDLSVSLAGGYVPQAGDSFEILAAASVNLSQVNVSLPALPPDLLWRFLPESDSITLLVTTMGDINGDGVVGILDFLKLLFDWGPCPAPSNCPSDLDGNGVVGIPDLLILLAHWT